MSKQHDSELAIRFELHGSNQRVPYVFQFSVLIGAYVSPNEHAAISQQLAEAIRFLDPVGLRIADLAAGLLASKEADEETEELREESQRLVGEVPAFAAPVTALETLRRAAHGFLATMKQALKEEEQKLP